MRVLRGRVVVRELLVRADSMIITPPMSEASRREQETHRGTVLAVGDGAYSKGGVEVPLDVRAGDTVQFHFEATEKGRTAHWTDGEPALWLAHREIDAVIEP